MSTPGDQPPPPPPPPPKRAREASSTPSPESRRSTARTRVNSPLQASVSDVNEDQDEEEVISTAVPTSSNPFAALAPASVLQPAAQTYPGAQQLLATAGGLSMANIAALEAANPPRRLSTSAVPQSESGRSQPGSEDGSEASSITRRGRGRIAGSTNRPRASLTANLPGRSPSPALLQSPLPSRQPSQPAQSRSLQRTASSGSLRARSPLVPQSTSSSRRASDVSSRRSSSAQQGAGDPDESDSSEDNSSDDENMDDRDVPEGSGSIDKDSILKLQRVLDVIFIEGYASAEEKWWWKRGFGFIKNYDFLHDNATSRPIAVQIRSF